MTTLVGTVRTACSALARDCPSTGWIGVDIGSSSVKLAQVQRRGDSWSLSRRWNLEHKPGQTLTRDALATGALAEQYEDLRTTRRMFRGRRAGVVLPTSFVELRSLDLPSGPWQETRAILEQELAAESSAQQGPSEFDAWQSTSNGAMTKILAVSAQRDLTLRVANDLLSAGLDCSVVDAVPCALARAVAICDPLSQSETVAALDWGYSTALLTVIHEKRPVFCRVLRGGGLQTIMQPLTEKLGITEKECKQLLARFGIPSETAGAPAAKTAYQLMSHGLENVAQELRRTLDYAKRQFQLSPNRLWLFGGGGTLRNAAEFVTQHTQVPTAPWRLSQDTAHTADAPLYGVAAGLSVLAWENERCM
jgi:type IV pilus assembly protein PilM